MIPLIKSTFYHETLTKLKLVLFLLRSKYLSFSTYCQRFECEFAKWQLRKDAVMVNSGSSANLAVIQALINLGRLKPGDKVGFSALTWATNVMPLIQLGLKPVPIDVDLYTLNVPSKNVPTNIKALFLTHLLGLSHDPDEIAKKCEENNIILIEDTCESLGSVYKGVKLGNYGLASTFSFYVGHHLSTVEGGMICTDDDELATELRIVRAHGWDRNLDTRHQQQIRDKYKQNSFYSRYTFYSPGYNLRPTEIQGFLGLLQLPYLKEIIRKRYINYRKITENMSKINYLPLWWGNMDFYSAFAIPIVCQNKYVREELMRKLDGVVETRPMVAGDITLQPFYKDKSIKCPNASFIHENGLYIGNNPDLTDKEINLIRSLL